MPDEVISNPNADSNFLAKQSAAADQANADQFLARVSAMSDADRRAELVKHGITDQEYQQAIGMAADVAPQKNTEVPGPDGKPLTTQQLETEREQVEGAKPDITAVPGPIEHALFAVAGAPAMAEELGISIPRAALGSEMANDFVATVQKKVAEIMPNHPILGNAVGGILGAALLGGGMKAAGAIDEGITGAAREAASGAKPATEDVVDTAADAANTQAGQRVPGAATTEPAGPLSAGVTPAVHTSAVAEGAAGGAGAAEPAGGGTTATEAAASTAPEAASSTSADATDEVAQAAEQAQQRVFTPEYQKSYQAALEEARRGVISKSEQQAAASAAPMSPHEVANLQPGTTLAAEKATALVNFERDEAERIQLLAFKAIDEGDVGARAEALQRIDNLVSVWDPKVQGVTAETGRALGSLTSPTPTAFVKEIREKALSRIGTPGYMTEDEVLKAFAKVKTPQEAAAFAEQLGKGGADGYATNFFVNSYISSILSPNSIAKKAVSDALNILYQIPARGLGELGGYVQRGAGTPAAETITPGETAAMLRSLRNSVGTALDIGWQSAKENRPVFQEGVGYGESIPAKEIGGAGTRFEGTPIGTALDWYGHLISVPGRGITAVDQAAKVFHYRMEMSALAEHQGYLTALGEGREGADFAARAADVAGDFFAKPPQWAVDASFSRSKIETFQRELTGSLAAVDQLRQGSWIARTVIPFFKTGTNITRMGLERTIPFSTQAYREAFAAGGRERVLVVAKNAMGDLLAAGLAHEYLKGNLTGYGPRNPQVRELWLKDNQPYSLKIAGHWVSLAPAEPGAWVAGMIADSAEMMAHLPSQDAFTIADAVGASTVREFSRQGFWSDLAGLFKTVDTMSREGVDAKGVSAGLGSLAGTMIAPQAFNDLAHGIDPVRRQVSSFMDGIRNRIPYLSESGIPTRDPFGKPVVVPPGMLMNEFPAFKAVQASDDPVNREFVRLWNSVGYAPPMVPKSMGGPASSDSPMAVQNYRDGVNLTPEQQDEWQKRRGEIVDPRTGLDLHGAVENMMKDPRYQKWSDQDRAAHLNRVFTGYREASRKEMVGSQQEIRNSVAFRKASRRAMRATAGPEVDMGESAGGGGLEGP